MMIKQNGCNYSYTTIIKYLQGEIIYFYYRQVFETNTNIKIQSTVYYSISDTPDGLYMNRIFCEEFPLPINTGVKSIYDLMDIEFINSQIFRDPSCDPCFVPASPIDFLKNEFPIEIDDDMVYLLFSDYINYNKEGFEILKSINNK